MVFRRVLSNLTLAADRLVSSVAVLKSGKRTSVKWFF